jgi:hypothetical protein
LLIGVQIEMSGEGNGRKDQSELGTGLLAGLREYELFLTSAGRSTVFASGRSMSSTSAISRLEVYELSVSDGDKDCGRLVYGCKPGSEPGKFDARVVFVPPGVTEDAMKILLKPDVYKHKVVANGVTTEVSDDDRRLYRQSVGNMYELMMGLVMPMNGGASYVAQKGVPIFGHQSHQAADAQQAEVAEATGTPETAPVEQVQTPTEPGLEGRVTVLEMDEDVEDVRVGDSVVDGWPDLEEKDMTPKAEAPPAPAPEPKRLDMIVQERSLADIGSSANIDDEAKERYMALEREMVETMTALGQELAGLQYDMLIILNRDRTINIGSSDLFRPYKDMFNPEAGASVQELRGLMAEYCANNSEGIKVYDIKNMDMLWVIDSLLPKQGHVALHSTDEDLAKSLFGWAVARSHDRSFSETVDIKAACLRMNGTTLHFVGEASREVFRKCYDDILENYSDLFLQATENPVRGATGRRKKIL